MKSHSGENSEENWISRFELYGKFKAEKFPILNISGRLDLKDREKSA